MISLFITLNESKNNQTSIRKDNFTKEFNDVKARLILDKFLPDTETHTIASVDYNLVVIESDIPVEMLINSVSVGTQTLHVTTADVTDISIINNGGTGDANVMVWGLKNG